MNKRILHADLRLLIVALVLLANTECKTFGKNRKKIKGPGEFNPRFVLTEEQDNKFLEGIVPNLKQNETLAYDDPSEKLISVPGCPPSVPKIGMGNHPSYRDPWVYYGNSFNTKCFLSGTPGPCSPGMTFYAQSGSSFGKCGCDCFGPISPFVYGNPSYCFKDKKHYAVYAEDGLCYPLMAQGPCESGEQFVLNSEDISTCEKAKCHNGTLSPDTSYFFDVSSNSCKEVGTPCETDVNLVYSITRSNWIPQCLREEESGIKFSIVLPDPPTPLRCNSEGQMYSHKLKRCVLLV